MDTSQNSSPFSDNSRVDDSPSNLKSKLMSIIKKSNRVFVGEYLERRLVQKHPYVNYKDIIVIDKDEEVIKGLKEVHKFIHEQFGGQKSLGITRTIVDDQVEDYKLWVDLTGQIPLGKHWFQIRSVKIQDNTVQLQVKHLRPFESSSRRSTIPENYPEFDINEILTYHNMTETLKFIAVVLMSFLTIAGNFLWYFSDYSIKLTRELSNLIRALTPICFGFYEFASRCVASMLWLIYVLFRGESMKPSPAPGPTSSPLAIMPNSRTSPGYNRYRYQSNYR